MKNSVVKLHFRDVACYLALVYRDLSPVGDWKLSQGQSLQKLEFFQNYFYKINF